MPPRSRAEVGPHPDPAFFCAGDDQFGRRKVLQSDADATGLRHRADGVEVLSGEVISAEVTMIAVPFSGSRRERGPGFCRLTRASPAWAASTGLADLVPIEQVGDVGVPENQYHDGSG
jgi:hypothetical protein